MVHWICWELFSMKWSKNPVFFSVLILLLPRASKLLEYGSLEVRREKALEALILITSIQKWHSWPLLTCLSQGLGVGSAGTSSSNKLMSRNSLNKGRHASSVLNCSTSLDKSKDLWPFTPFWHTWFIKLFFSSPPTPIMGSSLTTSSIFYPLVLSREVSLAQQAMHIGFIFTAYFPHSYQSHTLHLSKWLQNNLRNVASVWKEEMICFQHVYGPEFSLLPLIDWLVPVGVDLHEDITGFIVSGCEG